MGVFSPQGCFAAAAAKLNGRVLERAEAHGKHLFDDRQRSTAGQVEDCIARIEERRAQVGEVHIDSGRSAWNPRVKRPDWERLMSRLEAGVTDGVVVFDMARFSRRPIEGERPHPRCRAGSRRARQRGGVQTQRRPTAVTFRDQLNAAAYESDRLSTRIKRVNVSRPRAASLITRGGHWGSSRMASRSGNQRPSCSVRWSRAC